MSNEQETNVAPADSGVTSPKIIGDKKPLELFSKEVPYGYVPLLAGSACFVGILYALGKYLPVIFISQKGDVYAAIASSYASLLGFIITSATIFLTLAPGELLQVFKKRALLRPLFSTFTRAIFWAALVLVFSLVGLFLDSTTDAKQWVALEYATVISIIMSFAFLSQAMKVISSAADDVLAQLEKQAVDKRLEEQKEFNDSIGEDGVV